MLLACSQKFKRDGLDSGRRGSDLTCPIASWEADLPPAGKAGMYDWGKGELGCRLFFSATHWAV